MSEAPGVHDRLGHLGRADDQHLRLRLAERGRERRVLERRVEHHVAADRGEAVETRSLELVRDEDSHGSWSPMAAAYGLALRSVPLPRAMEDAMSHEHGDSYPKLREVLGDARFAELARLIRTTYEANEERRLRRDAERGNPSLGDAKASAGSARRSACRVDSRLRPGASGRRRRACGFSIGAARTRVCPRASSRLSDCLKRAIEAYV
jgi:hypothetical protein